MKGLCNAVKNNLLYTLIVEPCSQCNLACTFCDLHAGRIEGTEVLKGQMSKETFFRIVDQLAEEAFVLKELQYHGNGEPMMNKNLPEFISYAKKKGVAKKHRLTTNGTMLTPKNLESLVKSGVDEIHVSLDVADRGAYEELKGCDLYGKVNANLDFAIPYIEQHKGCSLFIKYAIPHSGGAYGFTADMANAVVEKYRALVEHSETVHLRGMPIVTQLDGKTEKKQEYHTACEIPFYSLFIKFDGKVSVCCVDLFDDLTLGNINESTLHSIINGEKLRTIRRHHLNGDFKELPICLYCGNRTAVNVETVADELRRCI